VRRGALVPATADAARRARGLSLCDREYAGLCTERLGDPGWGQHHLGLVPLSLGPGHHGSLGGRWQRHDLLGAHARRAGGQRDLAGGLHPAGGEGPCEHPDECHGACGVGREDSGAGRSPRHGRRDRRHRGEQRVPGRADRADRGAARRRPRGEPALPALLRHGDLPRRRASGLRPRGAGRAPGLPRPHGGWWPRVGCAASCVIRTCSLAHLFLSGILYKTYRVVHRIIGSIALALVSTT
jgi:hypothetical protein